jgi:hypothetical protein
MKFLSEYEAWDSLTIKNTKPCFAKKIDDWPVMNFPESAVRGDRIHDHVVQQSHATPLS